MRAFCNEQSLQSPVHESPIARGFRVQDEDTGSSPLAPLGLHAARLRMKPMRVIQPVSRPFSSRRRFTCSASGFPFFRPNGCHNCVI